MPTWKVKPLYKKSVIERQEMSRDTDTVIIETGWRWGEFTVETADLNPPELYPGVNIFDCGYESDMISCDDGCWVDYDMSLCSKETAAWLDEFLEENAFYDLEEHGWHYADCEMIIDCDMEFELLDENNKPTGQIHTTLSPNDG